MWGTLCRLTSTTIGRITLPISASLQVPTLVFNGVRSLSYLSKTTSILSTGREGCQTNATSTALSPATSMFGGICVVPQRGMKIKGRVQRRCKDCYLSYVDGILHNFCKTHPRHKQMLKPRYFVNLRILTHATSHFKRPW